MNQIRIGDTVKFISEKLEGKVTGLIDAKTVNVYCEEYGFEIPATISDLVVVHSQPQPVSSAPENIPAQKKIETQPTDTVYIALVPDNFANLSGSRYDLHFVNDTDQQCLYAIGYSKDDKNLGITAGNCAPDTTVLIGTYTLKELEQIKTILIQAIFYQKGVYIPKNAIDTRLKLNPVALCKSGNYKHVKWFASVACLREAGKENRPEEEYTLLPFSSEVKEKKTDILPAEKKLRKTPPANVLEVDLHIGQLLETTAGMENKDILEYQLNVFHKTLETYKLRKGQKIVFIHGKGDGVLRQRILWELQTKYKRFQHQDASFKQYGYGATLVTIK